MFLPTDNEPDFVNDLGTKWWLDDSLTAYAHTPNAKDVALPNVRCFIVELQGGVKRRLVVEGEEILREAGSIEDVATYLDLLKLAREPS